MTTYDELSMTPIGKRALRALCWLALTLLPGAAMAAADEQLRVESELIVEGEAIVQDEATGEEQPVAGEQIPSEATPGSPPPSDHATIQAPVELILLAAHEPEQFIGKTLVLAGGNVVTVGPVLDVRRHAENLDVYLIVDATAYFNSPTQYAVAVKDVDRIEDDKVVIPEAAGMHLRGMEYYPDDYTGAGNPPPHQPSAANGD